MGKKRSLGLGVVLLVVVFSVLGITGTALAGPVLDGPDIPAVSDPVGDNITPHNGYSATTDYCLQCHSVHAGTNDYALLSQATVSAVCNTCHIIQNSGDGTGNIPNPRVAPDPGSGGPGLYGLNGNLQSGPAPGTQTISGAVHRRLDNTSGGVQANWPGCNATTSSTNCPSAITIITLSAPVTGIAAGDQVWIWGVVSSPSAPGTPSSGTAYNGTYRVTFVGDGATALTRPDTGVSFTPTTSQFILGGPVNQPSAGIDAATGAPATTGSGPNGGTYVSGGTVQKTRTTANAELSPGTILNPAPGTASVRTAYDLTNAQINAAGGAKHDIGEPNPPGDDSSIQMTEAGWTYDWRTAANQPGNTNQPAGTFKVANSLTAGAEGLNCASCHTPHGEMGNLINEKWVWTEVEAASTLPAGLGGVAPGKVNLQASLTNNFDTPATDSTFDLYNVANGTIVYGYNTTTGNLMSDGTNCPATQTGLTLGDAGYCVRPGGQGLLYLHKNTSVTPNYWEVCADAASTPARCAPWRVEAQDGGFNRPDGGIVSVYGYRLLSAFPNHSWNTPASWGADLRLDDQPSWCGKCHPSRVDIAFPQAWTNNVGGNFTGTPGQYHNHPTPCTYCHGNPSLPQGASNDFPHTSVNTNFLKQLPDGLCLACHTDGLP